MNWLTKLSLRNTLLLIGVLPAALLSILLSFYFTSTLIFTSQQNLDKRGHSLAYNIANGAEFAMYSRNIEQLVEILDIAVQNPDVLDAQIIGDNEQVVAQSSNKDKLTAIQRTTSRVYRVPVHNQRFSDSDDVGALLMEHNSTAPALLGTIVLTLSTREAIAYEQNIILNSSVITLIALMAIGLIAVRLGQSISEPIIQISNDVQRIAGGDFGPSELLGSDNELGVLSQGIQRMSSQLQTHHQELNTRIQLATKRLKTQNQDLQKARQEAELASQLKSNFLSQISHEVRTPMNGVIGFLGLLKDTDLNHQQLAYLDTAKNSAQNLLRIINEVLDLSRLEAGKSEIIKRDFDLRNSIVECIELLTPLAKQRFVRIELVFAQDLPKCIHHDPVRINQVLTNLLGNAIKFSYQGEVTLTLEPEPSSPEDTLLFSIADQGCGIPPQHLETLFEPFTQFSSNKLHRGSSGLGLSIAKQIVDSMGGTIDVESRPQHGSTFWFTLPYSAAQSCAELSTAPLIHHQIDLSGKTILVADDNTINRLLLTTLLEKTGATVDQAVEGNEAVKLALQKRYDMLLLDIIMPNQTGTEALHTIRSTDNSPNLNTPAIAVTALPSQELQDKRMTVNFQQYLAKPIFEKELCAILQQFLPQQGTATPTLPVQSKSSLATRKLKPPSTAQAPDFDRDAALEQMNGNTGLLNRMLHHLFDEIPCQLAEIQRLIEQGEHQQASHVVHKMHGSAAYCGTPRLKQCAQTLEQLLYDDPASPAIDEALAQLSTSVNRLLDQPPSG